MGATHVPDPYGHSSSELQESRSVLDQVAQVNLGWQIHLALVVPNQRRGTTAKRTEHVRVSVDNNESIWLWTLHRR